MTNVLSFELTRTAEWRDAMATKYSYDTRNTHAAALLRQLAEQEGSSDFGRRFEAAHEAYENAYDGLDSMGPDAIANDVARVSELISCEMRAIGFSWSPKHVDEVIERLAKQYESAAAGIAIAIREAA